MGFTVEAARSRVLAVKAGKNNRTPVFVALDELLAEKGKDRIKELKENVGRALTAAQAKLEDAKAARIWRQRSTEMVDERGSPKKRVAAPARRSYSRPTSGAGPAATTRRASLTAPIVSHALEPPSTGPGRDARTGARSQSLRPRHGLGRVSGRGLPRPRRASGAAWARWPETQPKSRRTRTRSFMPAGWSRNAAFMASTRIRAQSISRGFRCGWRRWRGTTSSPSSITR